MRKYSIEERLSICKKCPIYNNGRCNSNLWINPDTNEISTTGKPGYVRGCNCIVSIKVKNRNNYCVAGKW